MTRGSGGTVAGLILAAGLAVGCGRANETENLKELQRLRSGTLDVVLLSPRDGLHHGKDAFTIEFKSAPEGYLVDVGDVRMSANMPMPGTPMFGTIDVKRTDIAGRYAATGEFDMAGTWRITIQWNGPRGQGSVTFSGTVQ